MQGEESTVISDEKNNPAFPMIQSPLLTALQSQKGDKDGAGGFQGTPSLSTICVIRPEEADSLETAVVIFEDFWVRTKVPLDYWLKVVFTLRGKADGEGEAEASNSIKARAKIVKCFKAEPEETAGAGAPATGVDSYLQLLSLFEFTVEKRFVLYVNTKGWLENGVILDLRFFKDDSPAHFAKAELPLAPILRGVSVQTGVEGLGRFILAVEKAWVRSTRRRIRIGSLKYHVGFGRYATCKGFVKREVFEYFSKVNQTQTQVPVEESPSIEHLYVRPEGGKDEEDGESGKNFSTSGLVVPSDPQNNNYGAHEDDDGGSDVSYGEPETENGDLDFLDIQDLPYLNYKAQGLRASLSEGAKDLQNQNLMEATNAALQLQRQSAEEKFEEEDIEKSVFESQNELRDKMSALATKVNTFSNQMDRKGTAIGELRREMNKLRGHKERQAEVIGNFTSKMQSLKQSLKAAEEQCHEVEESCQMELESMKAELERLVDSNKSYEEVIVLIQRLAEAQGGSSKDQDLVKDIKQFYSKLLPKL